MFNQIIDKNECTNCMACANICPKNAIIVKKDEYGFEYPFIDKDKCIDCKLCEETCQKAKNIEKSNIKNAYAIQSKDKIILKKSSSGGMFAQIAKYILSNNGIVFGCAMTKKDDKFFIFHTSIEKENELYLLQASKYAQSYIGNTYIQAKQHLENNRLVLFSGTPCQIAGLKAFLNKDYDNLLCVDLSCEGVPNQQIFNDYVKYLENKIIKHPVVDFKFRNKDKLGWCCTNTTTSIYQDKNKLKEYIDFNPSYSKLFINMNILRESCYNCRFSGLNRISDITIADAWGISEEYPDIEKHGFKINNGVSLVLINSDKGVNIFNEIQEKLYVFEADVNKLVKYNHPLKCSSALTNYRKYYLDIYKQSGYEAMEKTYFDDEGEIKYSLIEKIKNFCIKPEKTDCVLMTMFANPNYGSILTTYALQKSLENLGYSSKIINYENQPYICKDFYKKYCDLTRKITDFKELNKMTSTFIIGSDNLINCKTNSLRYVARSLFNYTKSSKKRIMIASSMGDWDGKLSKIKHLYYTALLKRFTYLSTREEHGKNIFENIFNLNSDWINDPVFYLDKEEYINIAKDADKNYNGKLMQYILYPSKETEDICNTLSKNKNLETVKFFGNEAAADFSVFDKNISVSHWLSAIINSELIVTDSFHCTAFALLFNKPVVCIKNTHATVRFTQLFKKLGIDLPLVTTVSDLNENNTIYDKEKINMKINEIKEFANSQISKAMQSKSKKFNFQNELFIFLGNFIYTLTDIYKFIFSIKNEYKLNKKRKIITILGIKIKIKQN